MEPTGDAFRASSPLAAPSTLVWFMTLIPGFLGGVFAIVGSDMGRNGVRVSAQEGMMYQAGGALIFVCAVVTLVVALVPTRVLVDAEGIRLDWLWRHVFIPHHTVTGLTIHSAAPANGFPEQPRAINVMHVAGMNLVGIVAPAEVQRFFTVVNARRATAAPQ